MFGVSVPAPTGDAGADAAAFAAWELARKRRYHPERFGPDGRRRREKCRFYLGVPEPSWLNSFDKDAAGVAGLASGVAKFVSAARLGRYRTGRSGPDRWPVRPSCSYAIDSGAYIALSGTNTDVPWFSDQDEYGGMILRFADNNGQPPDFCAPQDWPCEPPVRARTGLSVDDHQDLTTDSFEWLVREFPMLPWIPVLQGWDPDDYRQHRRKYEDRGIDLAAYDRVGIGSICRRGHVPEIVEVVEQFADEGLRLHGFGIKTSALPLIGHLLTSADSMAWSDHARKSHDRLPGCEHRTRECTAEHDPACRDHLTDCRNCYPYALHWREKVLALIPDPEEETVPTTKTPDLDCAALLADLAAVLDSSPAGYGFEATPRRQAQDLRAGDVVRLLTASSHPEPVDVTVLADPVPDLGGKVAIAVEVNGAATVITPDADKLVDVITVAADPERDALAERLGKVRADILAGAVNSGADLDHLLGKIGTPMQLAGKAKWEPAAESARLYAAGLPVVTRERSKSVGFRFACQVPTCLILRDGYQTPRAARDGWVGHCAQKHPGYVAAWPYEQWPVQDDDPEQLVMDLQALLDGEDPLAGLVEDLTQLLGSPEPEPEPVRDVEMEADDILRHYDPATTPRELAVWAAGVAEVSHASNLLAWWNSGDPKQLYQRISHGRCGGGLRWESDPSGFRLAARGGTDIRRPAFTARWWEVGQLVQPDKVPAELMVRVRKAMDERRAATPKFEANAPIHTLQDPAKQAEKAAQAARWKAAEREARAAGEAVWAAVRPTT